ncbi:MAG TPA: hypothetical protein VKI61_18430 [Chitinophagaceae bacterium]|nr:hypothetical protein [Chitinophagaceae bacterium]
MIIADSFDNKKFDAIEFLQKASVWETTACMSVQEKINTMNVINTCIVVLLNNAGIVGPAAHI